MHVCEDGCFVNYTFPHQIGQQNVEYMIHWTTKRPTVNDK